MSGPDATAGAGMQGDLQRALIEALARDGAGAFKQVLAHAPMAAEQRSLLELLLSLDEEAAARAAAPAPPASGEGAPADDGRDLGQEVADLREVNDTMAAALGACRACWGGDGACPLCGGQGRAGWRPPDRALFRELVLPAARRVHSGERRGMRPASRRPRTGGPGEWRQTDEW